METLKPIKKYRSLGPKSSGMLITVVSIAGILCLKAIGFISEPSFVALLLAACLIGLFIAYSERVKSMNPKSGEMVLSEIDKKHADILKLEDSVKEISSATLDMVEVSRAGSWAVTEEENQKYDSAKERLTKLLSSSK